MRGQHWTAGGNMTVADITLGVTVSQIEAFRFDLGPYPRIRAWLQRCKDELTPYGYDVRIHQCFQYIKRALIIKLVTFSLPTDKMGWAFNHLRNNNLKLLLCLTHFHPIYHFIIPSSVWVVRAGKHLLLTIYCCLFSGNQPNRRRHISRNIQIASKVVHESTEIGY